MKRFYLYVLWGKKNEDPYNSSNVWYVGETTRDPEERLLEHKRGECASTRELFFSLDDIKLWHKAGPYEGTEFLPQGLLPKKGIYEGFEFGNNLVASKAAELILFYACCEEHGVPNVFGAAACSLQREDAESAVHRRAVSSLLNCCYHCKRPGHFAKDCGVERGLGRPRASADIPVELAQLDIDHPLRDHRKFWGCRGKPRLPNPEKRKTLQDQLWSRAEWVEKIQSKGEVGLGGYWYGNFAPYLNWWLCRTRQELSELVEPPQLKGVLHQWERCVAQGILIARPFAARFDRSIKFTPLEMNLVSGGTDEEVEPTAAPEPHEKGAGSKRNAAAHLDCGQRGHVQAAWREQQAAGAHPAAGASCVSGPGPSKKAKGAVA